MILSKEDLIKINGLIMIIQQYSDDNDYVLEKCEELRKLLNRNN